MSNTLTLDANQISCLMKLRYTNERIAMAFLGFGTAFFLTTLFYFSLVLLTGGVIAMSFGVYCGYKANEAARQLRIHQFSGMVKAESVYKLISLH